MENHIYKRKAAKSYYVSNLPRSISQKTKIIRFILRYIVPAIYILFSFLITCFIVYKSCFVNEQFLTVRAIIIFIVSSLILGFIASILGGKWFSYISSIEDI